jgi:hypothetical protein
MTALDRPTVIHCNFLDLTVDDELFLVEREREHQLSTAA